MKKESKFFKNIGFKSKKEFEDFFHIKIEEENIKDVLEKLVKKLEFFSIILDQILMPDQTLVAMHESNVFNEREKEELYKSFSKLMYFHRKLLAIKVNYDEESFKNLLSTMKEVWPEFERKALEILEKLAESWQKEFKSEEEVDYFG